MSHFVLVTGGRDPEPEVRDDIRACLLLLRGLHGSDLRVRHGAARGVDSWAQELCEEMGIPVRGMPADWDGRGSRAGTERNLKMIAAMVAKLADGHSVQVVAFPGGSGTAHCAEHSERAGLDVSWMVATEPQR